MLYAGETCAAIIPCRDEARRIGEIIRGLRDDLPTIFVVDDGSKDETASEAERAGAVVLRHARPLGKGAALATAWDAATARGFQWALQLDGDGQHAVEDVPRFLDAAATGLDLVVGDRLSNSTGMPWLRRLTNQWMSRRLSRLAGFPLTDSQCGFRLVDLTKLRALSLRSRHFEIESEMCVAFARAGHRIGFVPVQVRYGGERSKISPIRDTVRWWRWYRSVPPIPIRSFR